eukprot:874730-Amorphochlora_amoeboformis.AAC.1
MSPTKSLPQDTALKNAKNEIMTTVENLITHKDWLVNALSKTSDEVVFRKDDVERMCQEK